MSHHRLRLLCSAALVIAVATVPRHAAATQKWGPIQLSGNLQTQNLVRHPDYAHYEFIQNRNTARIQLDYDWLQGGLFYNKYNIPFIESSHLFLVYRGVYDSIYDTTPGFIEKEDIHGARIRASRPVNSSTSSTARRRSAFPMPPAAS